MTVETQLLDQGAAVARNVGNVALQQGGGFFSSALGAPVNLGRNVISGIMSHGIVASLVAGGVMLFAPDLIRGAGELTGRTDISDAIGARVRDGGPLQALVMALGAGAVVGGGIGAASTVVENVTGGSGDGSIGSRLGGLVGTAGTFALAAVAIGAVIKNNNVSNTTPASGSTPVPPTVGRSAAAPQRSPDA